MATIKVACPKCGQKVSGDESFYGTTVECPICSADIKFPDSAPDETPSENEASPEVASRPEPVPPEKEAASESELSEDLELPPAFSNEVVPQAQQPEAEAASGKDGDDNEVEDESEEPPEAVPSPIFGAISMVSAVLGIVTCVGGIFFAPIAIIFGHVAGAKARHSPVHPAPGQTLGAVGMMIGYVNLVFTILFLVVIVGLKEFNPDFAEWLKGAVNGGEIGE